MKKEFKLSVVVPVYNVEQYLDATIDCVIRQTLAFEDNIQLILVNNGSQDRSGKECEHYQNEYSDNVIYIDTEKNIGTSGARNLGIEMAKGKYITFLDADDLWSLNAFADAVSFLEQHEEEIDLVSANVEYFEAETGAHLLNIDLTESQIIDIEQDYTKIRVNGPACIMKTSVAKQYRFDEKQECWEDTKFVNLIILDKKKYGMLADATYFYRRRMTKSSASQAYFINKRFFLEDFLSFYNDLYDASVERYGEFIPMMQYLMTYAFRCRFSNPAHILNEIEMQQYHIILRKVIEEIDDIFLLQLPGTNNILKLKMLLFKHNIDFSQGIAEWEKDKQNLRQMSGRKAVTDRKFAVLKKWFEIQKQGRNLAPYFKQKGYKNVAIYGMAELGEYLYDELKNAGIHVCYGIDRRAEKLDFQIPIMKPEDELFEVDAVIVTAVAFMEEIAESLSKKLEAPIISIEDVLNLLL